MCSSLILNPKLCEPKQRGVLCRAFSSDSPLRAIPMSWGLPGPLGTWRPLWMGRQSHQCLHVCRSYISVQSHPLPSVGASGPGSVESRLAGRTCMRGNLLWKLSFLMFRLAPALLSKSQQCQTAPCGLGWRLLAQRMYLLKRSYNFLLYCFSPMEWQNFCIRTQSKAPWSLFFCSFFSGLVISMGPVQIPPPFANSLGEQF